MLIRLKSRLEHIQMDLADNTPIEQIPIKGTLAVISGKLDFTRTDGYIKFLKITFDQLSNTYRKQHIDWQKRIDRIYSMAEKLRDKNVRFTGSSKDGFQDYCNKISCIMNTKTDHHLTIPKLEIIKATNLVPILKEQIAAGNTIGFYYDDLENIEKELMTDLMKQLSGLKMEKSERNQDVSYFLMGSGYHEHVHDALNMLMQTAIYAINCNSTKTKSACDFDMEEIDARLNYIESVIQRIKFLV